jgi:transketolase
MDKADLVIIKEKARRYRELLLHMLHKMKAGHIPSCFSMMDILTTLYYGGHIRYEPGNPKSLSRDKIIISKGHAAMALYPIFADINFFDSEELELFTKPNGILGLYADYRVPGIEGISGSLGHGIGMASGFILSDKLDNISRNIFVVIGDGECYEGSIWEAAMFASHHKLHNLKVILDRNQLCILGATEDLLELGDLEAKWKAFGWNVITIDGHNYQEIDLALTDICNYKLGPSIVIANTVKGKGVSFMEGDSRWHNKIPTEELFNQAFEELGEGK